MNTASLKQNKWVRRAVMAVLSLLALWVVLWLAVPPIAKSQIQKIASEKLGRQVTVGKVHFRPWTLEMAVDDLRIAAADASKPPQVEVRRLYADAALQSVFRLAPVVDAVRVESPTIRAARLSDGKYDFDDVLAKLASGPPPDPKAELPKFAIYNIAVSGGSVDFDDQTVQRKHEIRGFFLNIPFLSSLPSKREVKVEPKLAFVLNGSKFDSTAQSTPFEPSRKTDARINFKGLDLAPYLGYVPGGLPVKLLAGTLDADLDIDFQQAQGLGLKISGSIEAHDAKIADPKGGDLLSFGGLRVVLADVRPLDGLAHLSEVSLTAPRVTLARDAQGQFNLPTGQQGAAGDGGSKQAAAVPVKKEDVGAAPSEKKGMQVQVDKIALQDGQVDWRDGTTRPAAAVEASQINIEVNGVRWPMDKPASFSGSTVVDGATFKFEGQGTDQAAKLQAAVDALPLALGAPYMAQFLEPAVDGKLGGQLEVAWTKPELAVTAQKLTLDSLALTQGKESLASLGRLEVDDAAIDLAKRAATVGSLSLDNPKLKVERDKDKRWMFERWLKQPAGTASGGGTVAKAAKTPKSGAPEKPWDLHLGKLAVDGGAVSYADNAGAVPAAFELSALKLLAQKIAPDSPAASPVELSGRLAAGRSEAGRFSYKGTVALKPLAAEGRVDASGLPVHAFKAYFGDDLSIDVRRAFASYRGTVRFASGAAGPTVKAAGDAALEDLRINSVALTQGRVQAPAAAEGQAAEQAAARPIGQSNQLLSWKALSLRGLQVALAPKAPPTVDVRETSLTDFYARVIIEPSGHLNLQSLTKSSQQAVAADAAQKPAGTKHSGGATTTTSAQPVVAAGGAPVSQEQGMQSASPPATASTEAPAPQATAASANAPVMNFGPINLVNGKVEFTDLFIKPNYSADLSELTGKLSAISSRPKEGQPVMADLDLHGKAQKTAQLDITGKLNPLVKPLALDITAKMRDLDLAPLSTYSVRYTAHGIERGKLSMDVNYKITPDGRLAATNKLVLNQLSFGDQVKGAPNSLPVQLAVALLADRNGVIDVDLPISGSINDPQFSIGPLIFKAIVNLIVKAVTAPFSLLTGGLGGGAGESSVIVFPAGSSELTPDAKASLDKVAKVLTDRPALRLTAVGLANLDKERDAYKRQRVRQSAEAEKRRQAVRGGKDAAEVGPVTDAEYPALLAAVYKRADITKPRNMIGLAKDLPVAQMEDLLMANVAVDEDAIRGLALDRAAAVRDYLLAQKVPSERLFLGATRTSGGADWKPGTLLELAAN